jgi:N-acetylneuraminic acid mutarotase
LAAVATANHVYVIGGMNDDDEYVAEVEYAPILPDGRLGTWRTTSSLQEPRFYLAAVAIDGWLYAIGGAHGARGKDNIPSATVERARILADGRLDNWERSEYLTTPRRGLQTVSHGRHIYAIGGYNGAFLKSIEHTQVLDDGQLAPWKEDRSSTVDRYIHAAAGLRDRLYLLGGHVQNEARLSHDEVEMATIGENGDLRAWRKQSTALRVPRFIASAFGLNHHLYMLGGHDGRERLRSVEFAPLDSDGRVGNWSFTTALREPRSAPALVTQGDYVYVLGGMGASQALSSVEMARQRDDGHLGHYRERGKIMSLKNVPNPLAAPSPVASE